MATFSMGSDLAEQSSRDVSVDGNGRGLGSFEPIAIVGMAMRLPGNVHSGPEFWEMLKTGHSGLCDIPKNRYNINGFYDPSGKPGTVQTKQGYFLGDADIRQFDTSTFPMLKKEAERLDPEQRQLLEVTYECLENAGEISWRGRNIGCYIGVFGEDWLDLNAKETQHRGGYRVTGYGDFVLANRISYEFDLHGPSMTLKTGCSSTLVGLDLACQALQKGDCDGALIGGVNLIFSPTMTLALAEQGVLSASGICKTFDAGADGYARGEAVNMIYIKTLSQAISDRDPIRAVIRGTSVNCDGRTLGMTTPSASSQAALIRRAYSVAGIQTLSETGFFECHGTGTAVGDPIEATAVAHCFGDKGITITSVKPNVGHSEGAAGLTSLIKCILSLENRTIPPNIHFVTPNPRIPFQDGRLHVPVQTESWPEGKAERVSVNSFGIGGVNAHVIIESPRQYGITSPESPDGVCQHNTDKQILFFSANSASSLEKCIETHKEWIKSNRAPLADVAYSLAARREHKAHRAYSVTNNISSMEASPIRKAPVTAPQIAWVFTGQGAQWPRMGVELLDCNTTFRDSIQRLDDFLQSLPNSSWNIQEELRKPEATSLVHKAELGHPLVIAVQIALVDVLRSWGVSPTLVLGHSSGEMAAAYASGAITAEGAMAAATLRGTTHGDICQDGSMAAVGLGRIGVSPYMEPGVTIACENSQCSVTLSGDSEKVSKVVERIKTEQPGVLTRFLRVEKAFHSHHMIPYGPSYEHHLQPFLKDGIPGIPFFSSVTGKQLGLSECLGPSYWRKNMESPVLFNSAVRSALNGKPDGMCIVEIGPHPALKGPMGQIMRDLGRRKDVHLSTLQRDRGCRESLLHLAGNLFQQGALLSYTEICPPGHMIYDLPRYSWETDIAYWKEPRIAHQWRFREHPPHELLGARTLESGGNPCWRNYLALEEVSWLEGHRINGQIIFPGAGYIAMVGEALRQLEGSTAYTVRNVNIVSAMVIENDSVLELSTCLTRQMIDTSEQSPWYSFSISSYDGKSSIQHCFGEGRASRSKSNRPYTDKPLSPLPRKVKEDIWYDGLRRLGMEYTGPFQGLRCISTLPIGKQEAMAIVPHVTQSNYIAHPALIDQCFQLFTVASCRGLRRNCNQLAVPTFLEEMSVAPPTKDLHISGVVHRAAQRSIVGDLVAECLGQQIMTLKGFKLSALTNGDANEERPLLTQIEWRQHADFIDPRTIIRPEDLCPAEWPLLEELLVLCALEHQEQALVGNYTAVHLLKFNHWMQDYIKEYAAGQNRFVPDTSLLKLSCNSRQARIEQIIATMEASQYVVYATAMYRLYTRAPALFKGDVHPLHVLMEDNLLLDLYALGDSLDYHEMIHHLAQTNPQLRILEVGAGTGGSTAKVLHACQSSFGERLYSSYTYTDISRGFFPAARARFSGFKNIEYRLLDISRDPGEQEFLGESYDLIIASNVIHATPSVQATLRNLRSLLHPNGRLLMQELCPDAKFMNYIMGFLPGWWIGVGDNRVGEPYMMPERWSEELVSAGFQQPDAIVPDKIAPYHGSATIMASAAPRAKMPTGLTIMYNDLDGPYVQEMKEYLESIGVRVDLCHFGDTFPPSQDIISLIDIQDPLVHNATEESFHQLVGYLVELKARLFWVTKSSQIQCEDPRAAMILGLARTARNEMATELFTIEIESCASTPTIIGSILRIIFRIHALDAQPASLDPDWEYAVLDNDVFVPRMHWQIMDHALSEAPSAQSSHFKCLNVRVPGVPQTMEWVNKDCPSLGDGEVWIKTKAVGLNFRDVLIALGVLESDSSELGLEGSGVVEAIGQNVGDITVGDHVIYMAPGCFSTHMALPATACVTVDRGMSFEQAAGLPCVYATAAMALMDKACLQRGQTVLIHSACGGVGLAALEIAHLVGAEIYCTVGSEVKVQYLVDNYNIDRSHLFRSRDTSFFDDVMRVTDGHGVDVVLNSLSGELLEASWKCVAEFGVMIEIGKRDFRRRAKLPMEAFEANRTFVGLDLWQVTQSRPKKATELLHRCVKLIETDLIKPGVIARSFEANFIRDAFRFMQSGQHIGKIVITMPDDIDTLASVNCQPTICLRSDRSYLLVGGLGGLGQTLALRMVEQGARNIIFLSRSERKDPMTREFFLDLEAQGCRVDHVVGNVAELADVEGAVQTAPRPIAGVINLSMVLRDATLAEMTFANWKAVIEPKVKGTWNLHNAVESDLDFFILCSSSSGIIGQWGQANYSAANSFLDAFVQYRHRANLPASVVDIGAMSDVGFVSQSHSMTTKFEKSGIRLLREQEFLDAMALAMLRSSPNIASPTNGSYSEPSQILTGLETVVPISSPSSRVAWKRDIRMSIYHNINGHMAPGPASGTKKNGSQNLLSIVQSQPGGLEGDDAVMTIANRLAGALGEILVKDDGVIAVDESLERLGVDSLVAMEVRNWIRRELNIELSVFTVVQSASLLCLADKVRKALISPGT